MEQVKKVIEKYGKVVSDVNFYSIVDNHRGLKFDLQIDFLGGTRSSLKNDKILIASSENTDFFGNVTELKNYMKNINLTQPDRRVVSFVFDEKITSSVVEYYDHIEVCKWLLSKLTFERIDKKVTVN